MLRFSPARGAASFSLSTAIRGPTGAAATLNVGTTTTLPAGSSASVVNVGTSAAAIFNFSIPQGATGPTNISGTPTANQIATFANSSTIQGVSLTGLVKGNGASAPTAATAGTDYLAPPNGSAILKANSGGALANATAGTDYIAPPSGTAILKANSGGALANAVAGTDYQAADPQLTSNIRQNAQSAAYTTVLTDGEKHIYHPSADTTARTWTIDSNANVAYPTGTAITFVNDVSAGTITIAITSDTLVMMGTGSTGSRTLAAAGIATALKVGSTRWVISGVGLS